MLEEKMTVEAVSSGVQNNEISEENEKGDLNGREVEIQDHKDKAIENGKEFLIGNLEVVLSTDEAVGKAIVTTPQKLITACEEYGKAVELENLEKGLDKFGNPIRKKIEPEGTHEFDGYEKENDRDSWDCEY